jgi:hypothetical protein
MAAASGSRNRLQNKQWTMDIAQPAIFYSTFNGAITLPITFAATLRTMKRT